MQYLAPSGEIRRLPAINLQSLVAAHQSICNASPIKRAMPKREAIDGTPCPNCGASGWKGCDHQFAAPRPELLPESPKPIPDKIARHDVLRRRENTAMLRKLTAAMSRYQLTLAAMARILRMDTAGKGGLFARLKDGRVKPGTIVLARARLADFEAKNLKGN